MKEIACPFCQNTRYKSVFTDFGYDRREYTIVRCENCHFDYLNPQPSRESLREIYQKYYGDDPDFEKAEQALNFRQQVFEEICEIIEPYRTGEKKLLDIGCGTGEFLLEARTHGWQVTGLEVSKHAVEFAKTKRSLNVIPGDFDYLPFEPSSFEGVTILDVLEHLHDPLGTLRGIFTVLKHNGILIIRVPNTSVQLAKAQAQRMLFGKKRTTMAAPLHLSHFSPKTLENFVRKAGFHVREIRPGAADGEGLKLLVKNYYSLAMAKLHARTGLNFGNSLVLIATK